MKTKIIQSILTPAGKLLFFLFMLMYANNLLSQYISTSDALNRPPDQITVVSGATFEDNLGPEEQTYDARNWSTNTSIIYPVKIGNHTPGSRQVWVGGQVIGPQSRDITWTDMKAEYDGAGILMNSIDYLVVDGLRTDNVMDAVRPRGNTSTFRLSNVWATYTHDDAVENDNMMGGQIDDCYFDGCFMFLSQQSNMGSTLTWSTLDSLEIANTLVRLEPMAYSISNSGKHPAFESMYGVNADRHGQLFKHHGPGDAPLNVHDCIFYVPQYSVNGISSMDFPDFDGCRYSNIILLWTGGGYYPGDLPASGVTEYNLSNSTQETIDQIWEDSVINWISRHGYDIKPYQLTVINGSGDGEYIVGTEVTIQADTLAGRTFQKWTGNVEYVADQYDSVTTVTMPMLNISLTAAYNLARYHLTVNNGLGDGDYLQGTEVSIKADEPAAGKIFDKWTGDVEYVANQYDMITDVYMPMANISLTATYLDVQYQLTVNNGSGDGEYTWGTEVSIRADTPAVGKIFEKWTGNVEYVADQYDSITTVSMPTANISLTATYKDLATGLASVQDEKILIYPNPASDKVTIANIPENRKVKITKLDGMVIYSSSPSSDRMEVVFNDMKKGFYIVTIESKGKVQINKLLID